VSLFPNQFVNVRMLLDTRRGATLVPNAAVVRGGQGTFVYLIKEDRTVELRKVNVGIAKATTCRSIPALRPESSWCRRQRSLARRRKGGDSRSRGPRRTGRGQGSGERRGQAAPQRGRMNPSRLFILRPVATSLLMVAILLAGAIAYRLLPLSALPEVDYPTIQVVTFYPGASPDVATSSITAPLERQFGQMPGLKQMSSTSSGGASVITLQFSLDLTLDVAEQEVQAAINAASNFLPADLPAPPVYSKVNPADAPILTLGITSKTMPLAAGAEPRRHASRAEDLAASRRWPGDALRGPAPGRSSPGQSPRARFERPEP